MSNFNSNNRNTEIRSTKISDTTRKGALRHGTDTVDPNRLRELKNMTRPSQRADYDSTETQSKKTKPVQRQNNNRKDNNNFSPNTVGYIDPEEFERAYSKEIEELDQYNSSYNESSTRNRSRTRKQYQDGTPKTRGTPVENTRTGETLSTGRTSTRSGKGTGTLNDSKLGKWLIATITAIIIIGLIWFYVQNDDTRNAFVDSLTGNTTNPNAGETTHNIGDNDYAPKGPNNDSDDFDNANNMNGNGDNLINDGTAGNANANTANGNNIISANASGTVGSSRSGYYDEYGNYVTSDSLHSGDGRAFDADSLAERIAANLATSDNNSGSDATSGGNSTTDPADILNSTNYIYIIGEHDGRLAIFLDGNSEPLEVYDTYVADLPEADRSYIQKGIRITSVAELAAYLEDLTS